MIENDTSSRGMDPGMLHFCAVLDAKTPEGFENWPLARQRLAWNAVCAEFAMPFPKGLGIADVMAGTVPCRIFTPAGAGPFPVVLYCHGGGWVLGGFETHSDICAEWAAATRSIFILVDYRLAPEYHHPAQLQDCLQAWHWLQENATYWRMDLSRTMLAGDSAGGQLSVGLALALHQQNKPMPKAMVLVYPALDASLQSPSSKTITDAPGLSTQAMAYYWRSFLGPEHSAAWQDEKASPLLAKNLKGLPACFITAAGHDPLRDDGVLFHERLLQQGVPSTLRHEPQLAHSYLRARGHSERAQAGFQAITVAMRQLLDA